MSSSKWNLYTKQNQKIYSNEFLNSGFKQQVSAVEARTLKSSIIYKDGLNIPASEISRELAYNIVHELLDAKVIRITSNERLEDFSMQYIAELTVAPLGTRMMNVRNDVFTINNEHFNEKEIITALKIAYPERFI